MELKSENNLPFPQDVTFQIYTYLPLEALWLWSLTSKAATKEYYQFLHLSYAKTNKIIEEFIDTKLSKPIPTYLYDLPDYTFKKNQDTNAGLDSKTILSKKWFKNNLAFQKFAHDVYSQYKRTTLSVETTVKNECLRTISLKVENNQSLSCHVSNKLSKQLSISIKLEPEFNTLNEPVTLDMLKPYETEIRHQLGLLDLQEFLKVFESATNTGPFSSHSNWNFSANALEVPYLKLFNNPLFQTCYLNGYITFVILCERIRKYSTGSKLEEEIMLDCLELTECNLNPSNFCKDESQTELLELLKKHPRTLGYNNKELQALNRISTLYLINNHYASFDYFLKNYEKIVPGWEMMLLTRIQLPPEISEESTTLMDFLCKDWSDADKENIHFLKFFCKDLATNPQKILKGAAILELYEYIKQRTTEAYASSRPSLFKNPLAYSCESKVRAALALIAVLFEFKDKRLTKDEIALLTYKEDRLTKIVKTKVIEPLELLSLDELNPKTYAHASIM